MFGFIIGTASLIGLVAVLRSGRRHHWGLHHGHYGHHGHCGHHGDGDGYGQGPHSRGRRGGRHGMMWRLFERLDTTPGQEKVIRQAVTEVEETVRGMRGELRHSKGDLSRALAGESFDATIMGLMFARQEDHLRELQKTFTGALAEIHEALDPRQREILAEVLEAPHRMAWGGPYRGFV